MNSFPFTAQNGDRKVTTADFRELFKKYFTNGVFMNPSTNFQVLENSGMTITVKSGWCNINGTFAYENKDITLNIQEAEANNRIDRVVLRWNDNIESRKIDLYVVKGVASSNPVAPSLTRNESVYELGIATICVNAFTTNIAQSKITDTRLDASVCGVVAGTIKEADTTTLYAQIQDDLKGFKENEQAEFITWFNQIKGQLSTDQAGNLQSQIDKLKPIIDDNSNHLKGLAPMNLLINSDFQINQRGENEYAWYQPTVEGSYYPTLDMWMMFKTGSSGVRPKPYGVQIFNESNGNTYFYQKIQADVSTEKMFVVKVRSITGNVGKAYLYVNDKDALELKDGLNFLPVVGEEKFRIHLKPETTIDIEYVDVYEGNVLYPHRVENYEVALLRCLPYVQNLSASLLVRYRDITATQGFMRYQVPFKENPTCVVKKAVCRRVNDWEMLSNLTYVVDSNSQYFVYINFKHDSESDYNRSVEWDCVASCEPL